MHAILSQVQAESTFEGAGSVCIQLHQDCLAGTFLKGRELLPSPMWQVRFPVHLARNAFCNSFF